MLDRIGFVKKSQAEFYQRKGYRADFVMNTVSLADACRLSVGASCGRPQTGDACKLSVGASCGRPQADEACTEDGYTGDGRTEARRIGLYCSGDIEWKNVFNQVAAASLIEGVVLDCVPLDYRIAGYAESLGINLNGFAGLVDRDHLLRRMAANDINLFASYAEAAPLSPLESLELGVPCITTNNHHYWEETPLRDLLVVTAPDNIFDIHQRIVDVLAHREQVLEEYKEWKLEYDRSAIKSVEAFLAP
jgi:glycosyltransferase involved in cell wall biosynthesis